MADARRAYFAWRAIVSKRKDRRELEDPLAAFAAGYMRGQKDAIVEQAEWAQMLDLERRHVDLLETLVAEREAVQMVGAEEMAECHA